MRAAGAWGGKMGLGKQDDAQFRQHNTQKVCRRSEVNHIFIGGNRLLPEHLLIGRYSGGCPGVLRSVSEVTG